MHTNAKIDLAVGHLVDRAHGLDAEHRAALEVRREDAALVAASQDVVEGDEAELPRMRARPGDDDASRVEERAELIVGEALPQRSTSTSASTAIGTPVRDDQRVEVDRHDRRVSARRRGQSDQHVDESLAIDRGFASERSEQRLTPKVVDHLVRVDPLDRHDAKRHVGDGLGEHAADAEHHGHAELGIAVQACDELPMPRHHRRDEQTDLAVLGSRCAEEIACSALDVVVAREPQAYEPTLGLVRDRRATELHDHRVADRPGRADRIALGRDHALVGNRNAESSDECLGLGLGEGRQGPSHGCLPYRPCSA